MPTRSFVARADNDGAGIGTAIKRWTNAFIVNIVCSAFKMATGASAGYFLTSDALGNASWVPAPGMTWSIITGATNAAKSNGYFVNTTGSAYSLTLPSTPSIGDTISYKDYAITFGTNNLTIARNGSKIEGLSEDMTCSIPGDSGTLIYCDSTWGWRLF